MWEIFLGENEKTEGQREEFYATKGALLQYYSSMQASQATRLIGFVIALFTLIQAVQNLKESYLSSLFPTLAGALESVLVVSPTLVVLLDFIKLGGLFVGIYLLMLFVMRTIFRFSVFSYLASHLADVKESDVYGTNDEKNGNKPKLSDEDIMARIRMKTSERLLNRDPKLFVFPIKWHFSALVSSGNKQTPRKTNDRWGWRVCCLLALLSSLFLLFILW